ncbi:MtrB/PioB family decaheme-associated outer membrane protein [Thiohalomonas denitrificans]|uniref:Decaheme-associated outer membrane protein, MtrB/PioB family n=1 Tax=Thiohalomonas denitrificans TaxID=415747 RepID=A0A1G5QZ47_9GAMM|nr:MtrB/PioB family decaheme-associated outer membrane protein [Thiohalomonas denitrificans]SCZ66840.1 decaheme-associated outer membrane protein, MtrB/PioB family [Thiohalomonas denitrificans]
MTRLNRRFSAGQPVVGLILIGVSTSGAAAELWYQAGEVDKSEWECKYCLFESGLSGDVQLGVGSVDENQFGFGNYTGYDDDGAYLVLGADLRYRGEEAAYWRLNSSRLALDSRSVRLEGGRQGSYRIGVDYLEIPRLYSDGAETPFTGVGGNDLQLPENWVKAGTTDGMTELDNSLRPVALRTDRRRVGVGVEITPTSRWSYSADFRRERKEGLNVIGGSMLFRSTLLPEPVDYTTEQLDLGVGYQGDHWNVQVGYYGSFFREENRSLRWDNPFGDPTGANEGQLALPPDNEFHQVTLSGRYDVSEATRASAKLSLGRMTQNDEFLPYTVNPALTTGALPRDSLEGEVRTTNLDARLVSAWSERLTLQADFRHDQRDDETPTDSFDYVSTDAFLPGARENRQYDRRDSRLALQGRYQLTPQTRVSTGADYDRKRRPDEEVEETQETTVWAEAASRLHPTSQLVVGLAYADRDASEYRVLDAAIPEQNPLMVKFNMASREQERAEARLTVSPREHIDFGVELAFRDNDYTDGAIGLRSSRDTSVSFDATVLVSRSLSFHGFASREVHDNEQTGSQDFSVPDWFATTEDAINSAGVGVSWEVFHDSFTQKGLNLSLDYVRSDATGKIGIRNETGFPDLESSVTNVQAQARYRFSETVSTELAYYYERFESDDWMVDGVEPDTLPTVLTLGSEGQNYDNHVIAAYVRYRF